MPDPAAPPVPRGRHAPPLEVRLERQRERLFGAAARVFARAGYADASAEAIAREAGMSKATFYEHFANKEECILALLDAAARQLLEAVERGADAAGDDPEARALAGVRSFLASLELYPDQARALLVEVVGAGPRASERRTEVLEAFAGLIHRTGRTATFEDAYAIVGGAAELAARHLRTGRPADARSLEPVVARLVAR